MRQISVIDFVVVTNDPYRLRRLLYSIHIKMVLHRRHIKAERAGGLTSLRGAKNGPLRRQRVNLAIATNTAAGEYSDRPSPEILRPCSLTWKERPAAPIIVQA